MKFKETLWPLAKSLSDNLPRGTKLVVDKISISSSGHASGFKVRVLGTETKRYKQARNLDLGWFVD